MKNNDIVSILDSYIPNPKCPLNYTKDYELLIAVILSQRTTDEMVNKVTKILFSKYDINTLADADINDVIKIITPCGSMNKKADYIINVCKSLLKDYKGIVPNNYEYLCSLNGVGRKTVNVVLSNLYGENLIAVDTHVNRVAKRLGLANENDSIEQVENKLSQYFKEYNGSKIHHQLLLFGRYYCKSNNPNCINCKFKNMCKY